VVVALVARRLEGSSLGVIVGGWYGSQLRLMTELILLNASRSRRW